MNFDALAIEGAVLIQPEALVDERGFFARTFCSRMFADHGLNPDVRQCSISFNASKHTLRGMHYQKAPNEEAKLVRCTQGASHHVILDLRTDSGTRLGWTSVELNSDNRNLLYVPEGVAHGFITLADNTEIFYQMSALHAPESAGGVRWNDPAFAIDWPHAPAMISDRDSAYDDFEAAS